MYRCICGKEFEKHQSYVAHCGHCKIKHPEHANKKHTCRCAGWNKGLTAATDERVKRNGETYYNLPWLRSPKNHKYLLRTKVYINELNKEYKIKRIPEQIMRNYNSWNEIHVSAYSDRKSWKRNSKRSHQWK